MTRPFTLVPALRGRRPTSSAHTALTISRRSSSVGKGTPSRRHTVSTRATDSWGGDRLVCTPPASTAVFTNGRMISFRRAISSAERSDHPTGQSSRSVSGRPVMSLGSVSWTYLIHFRGLRSGDGTNPGPGRLPEVALWVLDPTTTSAMVRGPFLTTSPTISRIRPSIRTSFIIPPLLQTIASEIYLGTNPDANTLSIDESRRYVVP